MLNPNVGVKFNETRFYSKSCCIILMVLSIISNPCKDGGIKYILEMVIQWLIPKTEWAVS